MTHILQEPEDFAADALRGYCEIHARLVRPVRGGVLRSTETPDGKVALVIGGGSGHYPAFAGYVGPGLGDAAVAGDVFASPATRLIAEISRKAHRGAGILLAFGNYAGDVLNFGFAATRLRGDGIDVRVLAITDDIGSAPKGEEARRRGVAGDIPVLKIAGAAAEAGLGLDAVEIVARRVNDRTRSFGVAFGGCTLPGAKEPLFVVPDGRMAIGLGLHGEAGIDETDIPPASELAILLVDRLLDEAPAAPGKRVAVLLNGLGGTKQEELFVLWTHVAARLRHHGLDIVAPLVGEYATSLDMEGCSLTITWLDEEVEQFWLAPCDSAGLRVGNTSPTRPAAPLNADDAARTTWPDASPASQSAGTLVADTFARLADMLQAAEDELGRIDALTGDGDHGMGMARGSRAAANAAQDAAAHHAGTASVLAAAADAWADRAGGTSGAIWGLGLRSAANALDDGVVPTAEEIAFAVTQAVEAVMTIGGARPGDKTLVDAFEPFARTLAAQVAAGASIAQAWTQAADAAKKAADDTANLVPRLGRARLHAARSKGHCDAGAVSFAMAARTAGKDA
ncbi:MAG: dihydroxyacetone kinase family protein [Janthinobacterium lividum]